MKVALTLAALVSANAAVLSAAPAMSGWNVIGKTRSEKRIAVMLSLKKDMSDVSRFVEDVIAPGSANFRKWASHEEFQKLRKIADATPVLSFLKSQGVAAHVEGDTVRAEMTAAQVESIFKTTVKDVQSTKTGKIWHRAGDLTAPAAVVDSVAAVYGLHGLPLPPKTTKYHGKNGLRDAIVPVGPTEIRAAYQVSGRGSGSTKVRQAVGEFQGQFSNQQDLTAFFTAYVPDRKPGDDKIYAQKGNVQSGDGVEALLDVQYIMGIAPGVKTEFWGWQNTDFCSDLKTWTSTIIADHDGPLVHSISYGWQGDLSQIGCDSGTVTDIDADLQTIAAKGISIIFASGDSGSADDGTTLWPSWPASSPWVTAVGATGFVDTTMKSQAASDQFGSGSGFSAQFGQAPWQRAAVATYLNGQGSNLPPSSMWTRNGRATADVSALGEGYNVYVDGSPEQVGGTSASTPTFAAIISLVNDKRIAAGKTAMGFLNPWIYNNTALWTDITVGSDKIDRDGDPLNNGFNCATGWDPATGNGTPIFPQLLRAALSEQ